MPKVRMPGEAIKHFPYTSKGKRQARATRDALARKMTRAGAKTRRA